MRPFLHPGADAAVVGGGRERHVAGYTAAAASRLHGFSAPRLLDVYRTMRLPVAPTPRPHAGWLLALVVAVFAGCASRPPDRDGPEARPPPGLERVPDAVPRVEPLRRGGPNKPYEVLGRRYEPMTADLPLAETGLASWYGRKFHGQPTASGEIYDMYAMTAAHKTMPIPSYAVVRNPANGREVVVRVNDRGPFADGRVIDLSYTAALRLGVLRGVAPVQVRRLTHDDIRVGQGVARALPPDDPAPGDALAAVPGLWLQLGAFRDRDGAAGLQQRVLRESGDAVTQVAVFEENALYRVQAGPYATRAEAREATEWLQRRFGISALLVERR